MKKTHLKKILAASVISLFFVQMIYILAVEPTIAGAVTATDDVIVTLNVITGVTISDGSAVTMAPNLGISADQSIGASSWVVRTNSNTGYVLAVKASASPALVSGANSFADYTEGVVGTPELWAVAPGAKEFGFSAYGTDVLDATWGALDTCGAAGVPGGNKYVGFKTTDKTIASSNTVTSTTGTTTNICFAAEQDTVFAPSGVYTATITATASAT
jgi:hypothetical protein